MHRTAPSYSTPKHNYHAPLTQRFPQDIQCILHSGYTDRGNLYISNIEAAENPSTLKQYSIKAVLSCAKGYILNHSKKIVPHYLYIPAVDNQNCDISQHFNQAVDFIQQHLKKTNVLVHCLAGVSRSVSMVIAYLIRKHELTDQQAFNLVKSRRKIINPNNGFRQQLKRYHLEVSSSRSHQTIQSQRENETPIKQTSHLLGNYKPLLLKYQRTLSTEEKSIRESNNKYGYQNQKIKRDLLLQYKRNQFKQQGSQYIVKDNQKYHSPLKLKDQQHKNEERATKNIDSRGYFCNWSQDLDQRIQKIKQKYQMHRQKLSQTYYQRHLETTYQRAKIHTLQSDFIHSRADRFKVQSYHQFINKPNLQRQSQRDNYREINSRAELAYADKNNRGQFSTARTLATQLPKQPSKSDETGLVNTYFLSNQHYRIPGISPKKQELSYYRYTDLKNSSNKNNYRQLT